ncbi:MAG TPA: hypothetical protein DHW15_11705 [Bacteroidetes bacterium]|jgi:hypothetical protein|nr:hypothetical protein [Bacteroidota bacterium]
MASFQQFYSESFRREVLQVEKLRRQIIINYFVIGFVLLAGFIFEAITWMLVGIAFIVLFILFYIRTFGVSTDHFKERFFRQIQGKIGTFLLPNAQFDINRYIKLSVLQDAMLLSIAPGQYGGRNLIEDRTGDDLIQISEIDAWGNAKNEKGLAVKEHFFKGWAGIRVQHKSQFPVSIITDQAIEEISGKAINMQDMDASDLLFWTDNQDWFDTIFTPAILLKIVQFRENTGCNVYISTHGDTVCVATIPKVQSAYSDAGIWNRVENEKEIEKIFRQEAFIAELLLSLHAV